MTVGPSDSSSMPRWAGIASLALLPGLEEVAHADIAVIGIPFDSGVGSRPGARFAPNHVRESSRLVRPYNQVAEVSPFKGADQLESGYTP